MKNYGICYNIVFLFYYFTHFTLDIIDTYGKIVIGDDIMKEVARIINETNISKVSVAKYLGVSRQMLYNYLVN